jgi:hypothetical protein
MIRPRHTEQGTVIGLVSVGIYENISPSGAEVASVNYLLCKVEEARISRGREIQSLARSEPALAICN